jgi:hypothetical protein
MGSVLAPIEVSCAVEVFIATALLHQRNPNREDFNIQEIVNQVASENLYGTLRSGINVHASQHCVANKAPNPAKHRMLFATGKHSRRLVLPNDEAHPDRTGKIFPEPDEVPERYRSLLRWAKERFERVLHSPDFWAEDATERVRQLRSDSLVATDYVPQQNPSEPGTWLGDLLKLRLAGVHLADGTDPDEHLRQLREGWD